MRTQILHGASQYYATDHSRYPKDGFFLAPSSRGKDFLKFLLERGLRALASPFAHKQRQHEAKQMKLARRIHVSQ